MISEKLQSKDSGLCRAPPQEIARCAFPGRHAIHSCASTPSQDQRPGPPGTIRVRVRLIPVDVIVTDDHEQIVQVLEQDKRVAEKVESWLEGHLRVFNAVYGAKELPKSLQPEVNRIFESVPALASRQVPPGRVTAEGTIVREWDKAAGVILGTSDRAAETAMRTAVADDVAASGVQTGSQTMQRLLGFDQLEADAITLSLPFDAFIPRAAGSIEDMQNIWSP